MPSGALKDKIKVEVNGIWKQYFFEKYQLLETINIITKNDNSLIRMIGCIIHSITRAKKVNRPCSGSLT